MSASVPWNGVGCFPLFASIPFLFFALLTCLNDGWVTSVDEERDLGVLLSKDMKFSKQCLLAKNKANLMLGIINKGVSYKSPEVIPKLYKGYVRPHLEYCFQFWLPINEKDADARMGTEKSS